MATAVALPNPSSVLNNNAPTVKTDIDQDIPVEIKASGELRKDPRFEKKISIAVRDFKQNTKPELRSRRFFDPKRGKKRHRKFFEQPVEDLLVEMVRKHIRAIELSLDGVKELPSGSDIAGAVVIIRIRETGEYLCSLDKDKYNRWGYVGGRVDPTDLNLAHTLLRELKEETGLRGRRFRYAFIGLVPIVHAPDKKVAVFFTEISDLVALNVKPGREQKELRRFTSLQIHEMILKYEFLQNHTNYTMALESWEYAQNHRS